MNGKYKSQPCIVLDFKRNKIRIYRHTFHSIGDPDYFLFLVNPEDRTLAILSSDRSDKRAHCIASKITDRHQSYELCSMTLIKSLFKMCDGWQEWQAYRICGEIIGEQRLVKFHMDECRPLRESDS